MAIRRALLLCLFILLSFPALADEVTISERKASGYITLTANNRTPSPITLRLQLNLDNVTTKVRNPGVFVLPPGSEQKLLDLVPGSKGRWNYRYNFQWIRGSYKANHTANQTYRLPYADNKRVRIVQGYNGDVSHHGRLRYCTDFNLAEGTPVYCAREGLVVETISHFTVGRPDKRLMRKANLVAVLHSDGTLGEYVHLKPGGVAVRIGQKVKSGALLGYSGNTGYSSGPHLHFGVYKARSDGQYYDTLPVRFQTDRGLVTLEQGKIYGHP